MAFYYGKNKLSSTNVKLSELYQMKGVNINTDKIDDMRLSAYGSNTEGSHLGPGLNPWQSIYKGWGSTDTRLGLVGMNSPITTGNQPSLSWISEMDYRWTPFVWGGKRTTGVTAYTYSLTSQVTMYDAVSAPNWALGSYLFLYMYAMADPNTQLVKGAGNYITGVRRTISSTNYIYVAVGAISVASGGGYSTIGTPYATANFSAVNGVVGPLNLGQGDDAPYNAGQSLGSSTQHALFYRNNSNANKVRVVTTNTNYSATPTVSIGAEYGTTNYGNPIPDHGVLNMGKGTAWCGYHRGGNYQRVEYVNWTSGTSFATIGSTLLRSMSSSTTLQGSGHMIKISDEFALWFYPRRSGNTSGAARLIAVIPIYSNGSNRVPTLRGSTTEIATYDIGSISTQACVAAVGSSDTAGTVWGIVCWAETSAGNSAMNVMSWKYDIVNNSMTFQTGNILVLDAAYSGANTYRMRAGIKCLGYNSDTGLNYYELIIPMGDTTGGDATQVIISQNGTVSSGTGALTEVNAIPGFFTDSTVRIIGQQTFYDWADSDNRGWYMDAISSPGFVGSLYPIVNSSNQFKLVGGLWSVTL